jgi:hypothetical protein
MSAQTNITNGQAAVNAPPGQGNGQVQAAVNAPAGQGNAAPGQGNGQVQAAVQGNRQVQGQAAVQGNGQGNAAAPVHSQAQDTRYVNGQGNAAAPVQQGPVAQGPAAQGQQRPVAQGHVNAASATQRQGNADTHQQNGSVKILNFALFNGNDKLDLKNGSVADTLTEFVTTLLKISFPRITFPNGIDDQSLLEKSAYICYAFYEIAMWKNQGRNNDNLPDVKDVGETAVNRAINILNENMETIPEENKDKINEYIKNIKVATVG